MGPTKEPMESVVVAPSGIVTTWDLREPSAYEQTRMNELISTVHRCGPGSLRDYERSDLKPEWSSFPGPSVITLGTLLRTTSMATVTITAPANANLSPNFTVNSKGDHFRDASFSYLAEPVYQISLGSRRYTPDGEISIFDAEKYFKGGGGGGGILDDDDRNSMKPERVEIPGKIRSGTGTPSTCSELSWNSQSALLRGIRRDMNLQKQGSGKRFFGGFGCNCSGKKSVDIDEKDGEGKNPGRKIVDLGAPHCTDVLMKESFKIGRISAAPPIRLREDETEYVMRFDNKGAANGKREDRFAFPAISRRVIGDEEPRMSLDVFGSPLLGKNMDPSEHRRLMMLPYSGQVPEKISENPSGDGGDDDVCSDSSSDLFELGGLPGPQPALSRQGSDGGFSCMAPTEASIEWSVVTASAAAYSVAGSEYGDPRPPPPPPPLAGKVGKVSMVKEAQMRRQSGSLLGCKSSKAVNVAAGALKTATDSRRRLRSEPGNGAPQIAIYGSPQSVSRSHSPRALRAVRLI
ncbi:hypothetical protein H6P81_011244 [Aristolochia fimbriata]|uniref:Uncharacterized protein n=1 Tax=Aristolochia fimbriata TaxID=158543 RepID=A0AAV7ERR9_ARIFI|nr:hypothetical protein H6P81_011244 [Aristolochia fimbriata]